MSNIKLFFLTCCFYANITSAQNDFAKHPNTSEAGWSDMFKGDLSNAIFKKEIWKDSAGVFTASADEALWSEKEYNNFMLVWNLKMLRVPTAGLLFMQAT